MPVQTPPKSYPGILWADHQEIDAFDVEAQRFLNGEWDPNAFTAYRVKQGVYGQRQAMQQMIRIKIPLGILSADQMDVIGVLCGRYAEMGKGHVTTRENIQVHFTDLNQVPQFLHELADAGLTTREACGNTVRNVTGSPLAGICPREPFDVTPYAAAYARRFLRHPITQELPRKFKTAFSCCDEDDAITGIHDLGFIPKIEEIDGRPTRGFKMVVGGGTSIFARTALTLAEFVSVDEYLRLSEAVLRVFNKCDELRKNRQRARIKFHVHTVGIEVFQDEVRAELEGDWAREKVELEPLMVLETVPTGPAARLSNGQVVDVASLNGSVEPATWRWIERNTMPQRDEGYRAVIVRLPMGDISADQFPKMAQISRDFSEGQVRLTQQQNLVLRWVTVAKLPELHARLTELGFGGLANGISDVTSCPGTNSCKLGITSSMEMGRELTQVLADLEGDDQLVDRVHVKVSGCPNGCGQHHVAEIGLEGAATKRGAVQLPGYHLMLGGSSSGGDFPKGSAATRIGQRAKVFLPAKNVPAGIRRILTHYKSDRQDGELFGAYIDRVGAEPIRELLADLTEAPAFGPDSVDYYQDWGRDTLYKVERGEGECAV